jgi:phosphatidylglycerophosphatase A
MKNSHWAVRIATLDLPKNPMPGTVGAILLCINVLVFCFFYQVISFGLLVPVISFLCALPIIHVALKYFNERDPAMICLDEVVGMLITLSLVSINLSIVLLGFLLFRFFDITKPLGIKKIEQLPGAWGILLDDVLAGIYANLILNLILWFC